jgi:fructose-bisphosphate aldolase, class II
MKEYHSVSEIKSGLVGVVELSPEGVTVQNAKKLRDQVLEEWLYNSQFNSNAEIVEVCRYLIRQSAQALNIFPSSIQSVYTAMGEGKLKGFTSPAINIRGLTYDVARAIFRAAQKKKAFPVIFEIARSEIGYTFQQPAEYATNVLAAAIKEGYEGPLYIQGDHFQVNAKKYATEPEKEFLAIRKLIDEALEYGFFNIDIDTSTLVDLSKPTLEEQQRVNFELCAAFTQYIRQHEPKGVTVSVGGEIGEVGQKNSTVEELEAYMDGYLVTLKKLGAPLKGISKISVQTGTSHGGIPLPDGSVAKVKLDFETLEKLSEVSRKKYHLSGAVQHGASTLPDELFDRFPQVTASEIHLATGFQNMIYDHPKFPAELKISIYAWLKENCAGERKDKETDEQFLYKTRKKGFGPFKRQIWNLSPDIKQAIMADLQAKFEFLFDKLNVSGRREELLKFAEKACVNLPRPAALDEPQKKIANDK